MEETDQSREQNRSPTQRESTAGEQDREAASDLSTKKPKTTGAVKGRSTNNGSSSSGSRSSKSREETKETRMERSTSD